MALITPVVRAEDITPAGHEYNLKAICTTQVAAGDLLIINGSAGRLPTVTQCPVNSVARNGVHAIALHAAPAGATVSISQEGEITGFAALVPGTQYFRSAVQAGAIDDVDVVGAPVQMRAISATTIRYRFL